MRKVRQLGQVTVDVLVLSACFFLAYVVRYDFALPTQVFKYAVFQLPYVVALEYGFLVVAGAHRVVWRFVSSADVLTLARPVLYSSLVLVGARLIVPHLPFAHRNYLLTPGGVIVINSAFALMGILGLRIARRLWVERADRMRIASPHHTRKKLLLVGAGKSGVQVAREVTQRPDLGMAVVGFVDDDPVKLGTSVSGYRVLAKTADLGQILIQHEVDEVVIAITEAPRDLIRKVVSKCKAHSAPVKIIPGLYEIIGGQVSVSRLREVSIEDLLGREAVHLDTEKVSSFVQGKVVAVTGAGGSIGSELARQVAEFRPCRLLLLERSEPALFQIHHELSARYPDLAIEPCLVDITLESRLREVLIRFGCDAIIHAAAHKHVPMMEWNPSEAIRNNVLGTKCVADVAAELGVSHFVLISTDKAINPTSIMGASKRAAELYVQAMGRHHSRTKFVAVRFGNVLGSAGSVVPIFKDQIAKGGPVTITHPDMVRYFMTIPEAAQLVLQAATLGKGGDVFILDMGEPVKIVSLARDLIRLSGLKPDEDIRIEFTGLRPGEKLFEELSTEDEQAQKTEHSKIFIGRVRSAAISQIEESFEQMSNCVANADTDGLYETVRELIPEFTGRRDSDVGPSSQVLPHAVSAALSAPRFFTPRALGSEKS